MICQLQFIGADFQCQICDTCQCKMVNGYATVSRQAVIGVKYSLWTYNTDQGGNRVYSAAKTASGGGGVFTCGCPLPDNNGNPALTVPPVPLKRYQLGEADNYYVFCPYDSDAAGSFLEIGVSDPPQNAVLGDFVQRICKMPMDG